MSLPKLLKDNGYRCVGRVSMPVLNGFTLISKFFDDYKLMSNHNDFSGVVDEIEFTPDRPTFYFLNIGETHYPYMLKGSDLPHISGVHGAAKALAAGEDSGGRVANGKGCDSTNFFDADKLEFLHAQQIRCVEYVDQVFARLLEKAPPDTYFMIMADHGEAFGEGGYFGHGDARGGVRGAVPGRNSAVAAAPRPTIALTRRLRCPSDTSSYSISLSVRLGRIFRADFGFAANPTHMVASQASPNHDLSGETACLDHGPDLGTTVTDTFDNLGLKALCQQHHHRLLRRLSDKSFPTQGLSRKQFLSV